MKEETGLTANKYAEVFVRKVPSNTVVGFTFETHCFFVEEWTGIPASSNEGEIKWSFISELMSETTGAFPEYNAYAIELFKKKFPEIELK